MKTFGELQPGDRLLDPTGTPVEVKTVYDAHTPERMYELELEDGTVIEASGNHLWYIEPESDRWAHQERLKQARRLLNKSKAWREEALTVAESDKPLEIGLEDLMNFLDFVEDRDERYYLLLRVAESLGHVVEEQIIYRDYASEEETAPSFERVFDASRFFQQLLALTGDRKYRKRWPVIVGRVVTTDVLFHRYPDADLPVVESRS